MTMSPTRRIWQWALALVVGMVIGVVTGFLLPVIGASGALTPQTNTPTAHPAPGERSQTEPTESFPIDWRADPAPGEAIRGTVPQPIQPLHDVPQTAEQVLAHPHIPAELRRKLREALDLARAAAAGDTAAQATRDQRRASEPDPRVREALATGRIPPLGETRINPPILPEPKTTAEAGVTNGYWLTGDKNGNYQSRITVDSDGRAHVDTVFEDQVRGDWHVRYDGWAWRDSNGNLVIDGRGQAVEILKRPPWGGWSPDSMIIAPNGLIDIIDDNRGRGEGATQREGNG